MGERDEEKMVGEKEEVEEKEKRNMREGAKGGSGANLICSKGLGVRCDFCV